MSSLQYLSPMGSLYAVLPNSVAYSQKDQNIWNFLNSKYKVSILEESFEKHFSECSPSIILVELKPFAKKRFLEMPSISKNYKFTIFRGKIGMHTLNGNLENGNYLVHSTNLVNNEISKLSFKMIHPYSNIAGPAILLPRVGLPNKNKFCIIKKSDNYVLSDCILAIKTKTLKEAKQLQSHLLENWQEINSLYKGTGAKYITIDRLANYLDKIDII